MEDEMRDAPKVARVWADNRRIVDEWIDDYGSRTGMSREDIIADRQAHWIHDESAERVGDVDGFALSACPVGGDAWRYTVVTPWGTSEGLCDLDGRDDATAVAFLRDVIANTSLVMTEDEQTPKKAEKTPPRAPERTRAVSDAAKEPAKARKRGRPKGSKDSKPRTRRTRKQIAADEQGGGRVSQEYVAWIPDGSGRYQSHPIMAGSTYPQVELDGRLVDLPRNAIVWEKGQKPAMIRRIERKKGVSRG